MEHNGRIAVAYEHEVRRNRATCAYTLTLILVKRAHVISQPHMHASLLILTIYALHFFTLSQPIHASFFRFHTFRYSK